MSTATICHRFFLLISRLLLLLPLRFLPLTSRFFLLLLFVFSLFVLPLAAPLRAYLLQISVVFTYLGGSSEDRGGLMINPKEIKLV